jgi:hypothetical protein
MNEQKCKTPSIASLFPDLAWKLLTSDQQQQLLEYLEKVHEWAYMKNEQKEQERKIRKAV